MDEDILKENSEKEKEVPNEKPYYYIDWSDPKVMESILQSTLEFIPSNKNENNQKEK